MREEGKDWLVLFEGRVLRGFSIMKNCFSILLHLIKWQDALQPCNVATGLKNHCTHFPLILPPQ